MLIASKIPMQFNCCNTIESTKLSGTELLFGFIHRIKFTLQGCSGFPSNSSIRSEICPLYLFHNVVEGGSKFTYSLLNITLKILPISGANLVIKKLFRKSDVLSKFFSMKSFAV